MNPACGIPRVTITERVAQPGIQFAARRCLQHQVDRSGSTTNMSVCPILYRVVPEAPKLRSTQCDLEPVVTNEEEVVQFARQPSKVSIQDDVPTEEAPQYLGRKENERIQQRVPGALSWNVVFSSPSSSSICFSNPGMESWLSSQSIRCSRNRVRGYGILRGFAAHVGSDAGSRFATGSW